MIRLLRLKGMALALLAACVALSLGGCGSPAPQKGGAQVLLDGAAWDGRPLGEGGELRVYITLDGAPLIDLPFDEAHVVTVLQPGVGENVVELTGDAVRMLRSDCENQDCVQMGEVTRDNLEVRVLGGFIICLPHRISVEVRGE